MKHIIISTGRRARKWCKKESGDQEVTYEYLSKVAKFLATGLGLCDENRIAR